MARRKSSARKPHDRKFHTTILMGAAHNEVVSVEELPDGRMVPALFLDLSPFDGGRRRHSKVWDHERNKISETLCIMHNIMPREEVTRVAA